ncbi:AhpC/TSA family protein [Sinomicrobium kalidii]|uniref:TlpA disulfide reductase family protein n=1 Tax=Sinomicrobium kalidii TaxID=2900738 RepID=UPI001E6364BF|nr:TlpA disulfide reductase family protein [Sinomicrobium kalidii]UGU14739.1 AhpC/TSA family protein [Sinomicrobium kalidii]
MKATRWGILCFGIAFWVSCAEKKEHKGYAVTGNIEGLDNGTVYLEPVGEAGKPDSSLVENGGFSFNGVLEEPLRYRLKVKGGEDRGMTFILSNDIIEIEAEKDSLFRGKITGASVEEVYRSYYENEFQELREMAGPVYRLSDSITQQGKVEMTPEQRAVMDKKWDELDKKSASITTDFIRKHTNSVASALIIQERYITYPNLEMADKLYNSLSPEVQESHYGKQLHASLATMKKTAVGNKAPDFTQPDREGNRVSLSDFRGQYVFLDFWASWCAPCRKENPNVLEAYKKYHEAGLEIVAVSLDDKKDKWEKAIEEDGLTWLHLSDLKGFKNEAAQEYGVQAIPQNFLIDPQGQIIGKNLRGEGLQEKLKEVFEPVN